MPSRTNFHLRCQGNDLGCLVLTGQKVVLIVGISEAGLQVGIELVPQGGFSSSFSRCQDYGMARRVPAVVAVRRSVLDAQADPQSLLRHLIKMWRNGNGRSRSSKSGVRNRSHTFFYILIVLQELQLQGEWERISGFSLTTAGATWFKVVGNAAVYRTRNNVPELIEVPNDLLVCKIAQNFFDVVNMAIAQSRRVDPLDHSYGGCIFDTERRVQEWPSSPAVRGVSYHPVKKSRLPSTTSLRIDQRATGAHWTPFPQLTFDTVALYIVTVFLAREYPTNLSSWNSQQNFQQ